MKYVSILVIGLLSSVLVNAQQQLTLQDAITAALKNNYDILLSRNDSTSYALDRYYSFGAFMPQLNGTAAAVWNTNNQQLKFASRTSGKDSLVSRNGVRTSNLNYGVSLNWTLFDGLKMFATRERLMEQEALGALNLKTQVINSVAAVINSYYGIVRQKEFLRALENQDTVYIERVQLADKKLSVGLGSKPELLQAKVDFNAQRTIQITQQSILAQLRDQLNQLIGFKLGSVYEVEDTIPLNMTLQYGEFAQKFEESNPLLLAAKKSIDVANLGVKEQKAGLWPTLSFNSAYNFAKTNNSVVVNQNQPFYNQNRGFNYGFGLNVPILNGFNTRRLIKQAQLNVQYQQLNYEKQHSLIDVGISNSFKDYELQKKLLDVEYENILMADENVNIALQRLKQGVTTSLELREAQKSQLDAYIRLITAKYNTKMAETELLRLKGDLLK
ncbi:MULTISPECIES: TolC family protein [Niastella]|uniref:TolC family protein n=1 Tax=Niastella soli TaxID=2821487 RepID=A0ABS3Z5B2_9BACT|nr:TolC family protein [Niastella soli]MBO9205356.1 TolC family protein [Niastella soli]